MCRISKAQFTIVLFACLFPISSYVCAQDKDIAPELNVELEALVSKIKANSIDGHSLFNGLGVKSERIEQRPGNVRKITTNFDQLENDIWRSVTTTKTDHDTDFNFAMVRNGDFSFNATSSSAGVGFGYGKLGFDAFVHNEVKKNWISQFPYPIECCMVSGTDLGTFLQAKGLVPTALYELPDYLGERVEGIQFETNRMKGEIHWLPDRGYLIRHAKMVLTTPQGEDKTFKNILIDFKTHGDRLLPYKVVFEYGPENTCTYEIIEINNANPNVDFYTAEEFGLETPSKPWSAWQKWALVAFFFLAIGLFFRLRS